MSGGLRLGHPCRLTDEAGAEPTRAKLVYQQALLASGNRDCDTAQQSQLLTGGFRCGP
jgi:hypothetical protein